jgi:cytidylate kinase
MPRPAGLILAIDGVVGAGKSTTARKVAAQLGYRHLDTGAMYRAVALKAVGNGVAAADAAALQDLLAGLQLEFKPGGQIWLDGEDVTAAIRRPEVSRQVGAYADQRIVRQDLVRRQQEMGVAGGVVAEGRDIGTVVFPDAELKIRLIASLEQRTQRRYRELAEKGVEISPEQVRSDIEARDLEDAKRDYGAVAGLGSFIELDTTGLTLEQQVSRIVVWAREHGA